MNKYHKIQSIYKRDPETHRFDGRFSMDEFEVLADLTTWEFSEKLDGMNMRIGFDPEAEEGERFQIGGRTDKAEIPGRLRDAIGSLTYMTTLEEISAEWGARPVTLIGEGIGAKIQRGADYHLGEPKNEFVLFDVLVGNYWMSRSQVAEVASLVGCRVTPVIGSGCIEDAVSWASRGFPSYLEGSAKAAEGLVIRPPVEMFGRFGQRIIAKVKTKDFAVKPE